MRHLKANVQGGGGGRFETLNGREYFVFPVVALRSGVRHAGGASAPEMIPVESFGRYPDTWNGRPIVLGHPVGADGAGISASSRDVLEEVYLGKIMNTRVAKDALLVDAWIDVEVVSRSRNASVQELWRRLRAGEVCEVSVGAMVNLSDQSGTFNGKPYSQTWDIVIPDHLAFFTDGTTGACSVKDGCGTFRALPRAALDAGDKVMLKAREQVQRLLHEHLGDGAQVVHLREGSAVFRVGEDFEEGPGLYVVQMRVAHNGANAGEVTLIGQPEPLDFGGTEKPVASAPAATSSPVLRKASRGSYVPSGVLKQASSRAAQAEEGDRNFDPFDPFSGRVAADPRFDRQDESVEEETEDPEMSSGDEGSEPGSEEDPTYAEDEAEHVRPSERARRAPPSRRGKSRVTPPRRDDMHK